MGSAQGSVPGALCPGPWGVSPSFPHGTPPSIPPQQSRGQDATPRLLLTSRLSMGRRVSLSWTAAAFAATPGPGQSSPWGSGMPPPCSPRGGWVGGSQRGALAPSAPAGQAGVPGLVVQGGCVPLSWGSTRFPLPLPAHLPLCSGSLSGLPHTRMWDSGRFWNGPLSPASLFCSFWGVSPAFSPAL